MKDTAAFQKGTTANREDKGLPGPTSEAMVLLPGNIQRGRQNQPRTRLAPL
jgi:hypothetical protein